MAPGGGALDDCGVAVFGEVGVVGAHPAQAGKIDAMLVLEDAAHPDAGGLRVAAHGDAAAFQVLRFQLALRGIVDDGVVLEARHHHGGQQDERLAVNLGLQEAADGELAGVKGALADHRLEALVGRLRPAEVELDEVGADLALLEGTHHGVVREVGLEADLAGGGICAGHDAVPRLKRRVQ